MVCNFHPPVFTNQYNRLFCCARLQEFYHQPDRTIVDSRASLNPMQLYQNV